MAQTDDIDLGEFKKSPHLEKWAQKVGVNLATAEDIFRSATYMVREMIEDDVPPPQALLTLQVCFNMMAFASNVHENDFHKQLWADLAQVTENAAREVADQWVKTPIDQEGGIVVPVR